MTPPPTDELCEQGQRELIATQYLQAAATFSAVSDAAWESGDWDLLARVQLPLQEAHRQIRQRCGEGVVRCDLTDAPDPAAVPQGQLLIAGPGTVEPAAAVRRRSRGRYVETFLGARFPIDDHGTAVVVVPRESDRLPEPTPRSIQALSLLLPAGAFIVDAADLPASTVRGTTGTYAAMMALWERLHRPFLAAADAVEGAVDRIACYRMVIEIDPACELAYQGLAASARQLERGR